MACGPTRPTQVDELRLASFRIDVTPPLGHSLCGGWIQSVVGVDDPLEAIGVVLLGAGAPIVLCAVDWTGILNSAHLRWRQALADAVGTTADRVAVHSVHQHNAPFACLDTQRIVAAHAGLPHVVDPEFFEQCLSRARRAAADALARARRVTHVAGTSTRVEKVASNRRISRNAANQVIAMRGSATRDEALRAMPEGLIDPDAKTIAFYDGEQRIAALHYYATHPMSYYGDGRVSSDFAGLARKRLQAADPGCTHLYFTGCAGNVTAGKYNDGSKPMREVLTTRLHDALAAGLGTLRPEPITQVSWRSADLLPLSQSEPRCRHDREADRQHGRNRRQSQSAGVSARLDQAGRVADAHRDQCPPAQSPRHPSPASRIVRRVSACRPEDVPGSPGRDRGLRRRRTVVHPHRRRVRLWRLRSQRRLQRPCDRPGPSRRDRATSSLADGLSDSRAD